MASRKPLTDDEGEVRELTAEDFKRFVPFSALPSAEKEKVRSLRRYRGPQKSPRKELISKPSVARRGFETARFGSRLAGAGGRTSARVVEAETQTRLKAEICRNFAKLKGLASSASATTLRRGA